MVGFKVTMGIVITAHLTDKKQLLMHNSNKAARSGVFLGPAVDAIKMWGGMKKMREKKEKKKCGVLPMEVL